VRNVVKYEHREHSCGMNNGCRIFSGCEEFQERRKDADLDSLPHRGQTN
jgi:hypothetical protein